jgi:hypothetical protein
MSTFLGFESYLIPLGSTNQNVIDTLRTAITNYGWQCNRQSLIPIAILGTMANPANALDQIFASVAGDSSELPKWVGFETNSGFTPTVMYLQGHMDALTTAPMAFTLDWSDDGSTWTTQQAWTTEINWYSYERRRYIINGAGPHTYWRINVTARQSGQSTTYINDWVLEDANNNWVTNQYFFDIMPPATETIGNSYFREIIRCKLTSPTTITWLPLQELLTSLPPLLTFDTAIAGAVTLSITINGVTVSYSGINTNSAFVNARGLFEACKNSTDSNFVAFNWYWNNQFPNVTGSMGYFYIVKKTATNVGVVNSTNITTRLRAGNVPVSSPLVQASALTWPTSTTIDLTNGFIYYLQVNSRGLAFACKTNSTNTGPVHMCYASNAEALAQVPPSPITEIPLSPIELLVGWDDTTVMNVTSYARVSHRWVVMQQFSSWNFQTDVEGYYSCGQSFNKMGIAEVIQDGSCGCNTGDNIDGQSLALCGEGIFSGGDSGNHWPIHKMGPLAQLNWATGCGDNNPWQATPARSVLPSYSGLDWYRHCSNVADEQLLFSPSTDFTTTLSSPMGPTDVIINVVSTAGFPTAGFLVIGNEAIEYTGLTETSFIGCTRAKYGSTAMSGFIGDTVYIGSWFVKFQYGLLFAGYAKPV